MWNPRHFTSWLEFALRVAYSREEQIKGFHLSTCTVALMRYGTLWVLRSAEIFRVGSSRSGLPRHVGAPNRMCSSQDFRHALGTGQVEFSMAGRRSGLG